MGANLSNVTSNGPWALVFQLGLVGELNVSHHGNSFTAENVLMTVLSLSLCQPFLVCTTASGHSW